MGRVVVIGAGLAGLSCAAALAARGAEVTVLEAQAEVGGKARQLKAGGASIDIGPTVLADLAPLRRLFAEAGADLDKAVRLERVDPGFVATFPGGARFALHADAARTTSSLAALGRHAPADWERLLDLGARAQRLAQHYYRRGDIGGARDLARFVLGGGVAVRDVLPFARSSSLEALLTSAIRTPELRRLLAHFARFVGLDAGRAPAVTLAIPHLLATSGVWYPRGGVGKVVRTVADLARERGAVIEDREPVERLERSGARVTAAVTSAGRRVEAACFVSAVDVGRTARFVPGTRLARSAARLVPARTAHVAWWVVDGAAVAGPHHAFHFEAEPGDEPLYVTVPTTSDPELAPPGVGIVYALVHRLAGTVPGKGFAEQMAARLLAAGQWPSGRVIARGVAAGPGSCYGYTIGPGLFASFRPSQRVPELGNLILAGGSVFPGPGLANVVRSGLRAAELAGAGIGLRAA